MCQTIIFVFFFFMDDELDKIEKKNELIDKWKIKSNNYVLKLNQTIKIFQTLDKIFF